jgi:pimeloyl-ACP methyl ester carboxylesterase
MSTDWRWERMLRLAKWLVTVLVMSNSPATGQSGFTMGYHTYKGFTYSYYLFSPANLDPRSRYPLVLCCHGVLGEVYTPSMVVKFFGAIWADSAHQAKWPSFVLIPIDLYNNSNGLAENDLLDTLLGQYPIDTGRLYLTGMSRGGGITWGLISDYPNKFAAAVPVCGWGDSSKAALIKHIPLWIFHGALDHSIPVSESREMIAALERAGATPVFTEGLSDSVVEDRIRNGARLLYTEYPNAGHDIWSWAYSEPLLLPWVFQQKVTTGIVEHPHSSVPMEYRLLQNYPNPFNPTTAIRYELPRSSQVRLSVYDMLGREVSVLVKERRDPGVHEVKFDASNLPSGVYLYRLRAGDFIQSRKFVLLR